MSNEQKRDLALFEGQYLYIQDGSKGAVKVVTGPNVVTPSAQDKPVVYDHQKGTFIPAATLEEAVRKSAVAVEGFYIELLNPAKEGKQPVTANTSNSSELLVGRKVNIPGPAMFALWPGQVATIIRGHHLRSNQYLLCRVYNEEEARKNWGSAIMKRAVMAIPPAEDASEEVKNAYAAEVKKAEEATRIASAPPQDLTVGKLFIIKGTEVSFYIPPTGVTVVPEGGVGNQTSQGGHHGYVRDALTLESLEYAVLVSESGKKRYEIGPSVVFPSPTERFITLDDKKDTKKHRAIELNDLQGIHIKVIADYEEKDASGNVKKFTAGQELFITGKEMPIYYPREEHAAVKYDGKTKHFATAVPAGEARYVMDRITGKISMVEGPTMLLPDPRTHIIVRRALSDKQVSLWYPGNAEALAYNQSIRSIAESSPTTRQGAVSEGEILRNAQKKGLESSLNTGMRGHAAATVSSAYFADASNVSREQNVVGDELTRTSGYNQPRTLTLTGKYQGVPGIDLWTNYAVQVVQKTGGRRVEIGPKSIKLQYDESLEVLELSTGKPKNTDNLLKTVYLKVRNNKVSDRLYVETSDHVRVDLLLSYVINFEGNSEKWFSVENYVKFLTDHMRSVLKSVVRKLTIADFYAKPTEVIRETLGENGLTFEENNMRLYDIEVLSVEIKDERINKMMSEQQQEVVRSNLEVASAARSLEVAKKKEAIEQDITKTKAETLQFKNDSEKTILASQLSVSLVKYANSIKEQEELLKVEKSRQEVMSQSSDAKLAELKKTSDFEIENQRQRNEQKVALLKAETEAAIERYKAIAGSDFSAAVTSLSNNEVLVKIADALNLQRSIGGDNLVDSLHKVFAGTPFAAITEKIMKNAPIPQTSNGAKNVASTSVQS